MKIEFVPSKNDWDKEIDYEKYGFEVLAVVKDGKETDFKAIYRKDTDRIIAIPRQNYKLLPNEIVLGMANSVASKAGLKPFKMISQSIDDWRTFNGKSKYKTSKKDGFTMVQEIKEDPHALIDRNATRMYAFYSLPKVKMDSKEELNFGLCVANSVDTTQGLSIMAFSYRHLCQNASLMTLKIVMASNKNKLGRFRRKHTKFMQIDPMHLEEFMQNAVVGLENIQKAYGKWMVEPIEKETVRKVGKVIPQKYLPEYINVDGKKITLTLEPTPTKWKVYNDLTQAIWHEPVELRTKQVIYENMHEAFGL